MISLTASGGSRSSQALQQERNSHVFLMFVSFLEGVSVGMSAGMSVMRQFFGGILRVFFQFIHFFSFTFPHIEIGRI